MLQHHVDTQKAKFSLKQQILKKYRAPVEVDEEHEGHVNCSTNGSPTQLRAGKIFLIFRFDVFDVSF